MVLLSSEELQVLVNSQLVGYSVLQLLFTQKGRLFMDKLDCFLVFQLFVEIVLYFQGLEIFLLLFAQLCFCLQPQGPPVGLVTPEFKRIEILAKYLKVKFLEVPPEHNSMQIDCILEIQLFGIPQKESMKLERPNDSIQVAIQGLENGIGLNGKEFLPPDIQNPTTFDDSCEIIDEFGLNFMSYADPLPKLLHLLPF